jgi:tRNA pseudouridine32 synthase / 23S rRNA pseudouridine746 synthase
MNQPRPLISHVIQKNIRLGEFVQSSPRIRESLKAHLCDYGAAWLTPAHKKIKIRLRDTQSMLQPKDRIEIYVDEKILTQPPLLEVEHVHLEKDWGVFIKPVGALSQGTFYGDQTSMMYALEKKFKTPYLIHRLDRETHGLMLFAFTSQMAATFSKLFQTADLVKKYHGIVVGKIQDLPSEGTIDEPLDQKAAVTHFKVLKKGQERALVEFELKTGRFHQIRRHLLSLGCSLWGDPRYGQGNKNSEGLKLSHVHLEFSLQKRLQVFHTKADFHKFVL